MIVPSLLYSPPTLIEKHLPRKQQTKPERENAKKRKRKATWGEERNTTRRERRR
jgi:hypothetical protein